ncbi:MAG: glycosyltransferase family 4 protein [Ginsengibacter sp.]
MKRKGNLKIAFVQWVLPLYRLGFYKELSKLNTSYSFTLFCPQGEDRVTNIKTISPEQLLSATNNNKINWVNTKVSYSSKGHILWQSGIIMPLLRKEYDVFMLANKMSHLFYWLLILISKLRGIKIIFWSHGLQGNETGLKLWIKKWYLGLPNVNLVYANYGKELLIEAGFKPNTVQVVYNSLDFSEQDKYYDMVLKENKSDLKQKFIKNNYPVIIFLGRLEKEKKIDMILQAAQILKNRGFYINILIAGQGTELERLKNVADDLMLTDSVYFLGRLEEPELVKYFYFSEISVSPGNVGLNCIHSLNYGVPVITHNDFRYQLPEFEILIDKETGVFFEKDNVEDLANKIQYWLENYSKKDISEKLRDLVKSKYSPNVQAQYVLDGISLLNNT